MNVIKRILHERKWFNFYDGGNLHHAQESFSREFKLYLTMDHVVSSISSQSKPRYFKFKDQKELPLFGMARTEAHLSWI